MLISRIEKKKINCTPVPEGKHLSGHRTSLCYSNCHVDGTWANASCPFPSNCLREGLQVKESPVLLFLSGCCLKRCVCILIQFLMNPRSCFNAILQKIKRECLKGIMWAWEDYILIKLIAPIKEACNSVHLDKSNLTLWEAVLNLFYALGSERGENQENPSHTRRKDLEEWGFVRIQITKMPLICWRKTQDLKSWNFKQKLSLIILDRQRQQGSFWHCWFKCFPETKDELGGEGRK